MAMLHTRYHMRNPRPPHRHIPLHDQRAQCRRSPLPLHHQRFPNQDLHDMNTNGTNQSNFKASQTTIFAIFLSCGFVCFSSSMNIQHTGLYIIILRLPLPRDPSSSYYMVCLHSTLSSTSIYLVSLCMVALLRKDLITWLSVSSSHSSFALLLHLFTPL